jgi:transcriptional regulator with XRE-family HTH domain
MQPLPLEQWRRRRPWTQKELAESSGVSVGTVRGIEHGYYKSVRPRVMRAIAGALDLQPADVLEFRPSLGLGPESPGAPAAAPPGAAAASPPAIARDADGTPPAAPDGAPSGLAPRPGFAASGA